MTRKGHSLFSFGRCCGEAKEVDALFMVQPSPLGVRNAVPAGERGWIYFERLVSTIRVALTDEQYAARTVYANVPELKEAILVRAKKLRESATKGNEELTESNSRSTQPRSTKRLSQQHHWTKRRLPPLAR
ncbi:unnamed protein product [Durusdinium trenchii]|uniref:Uncharacterized protein n=1 Tax=Durusdinium trenchii TaxID=1381693 RepID=A0ABP0PZW8_9DINO